MYVNQDPKRSIGQGQTMKYSLTSLQDFFQQESGMGLSPNLSSVCQLSTPVLLLEEDINTYSLIIW